MGHAVSHSCKGCRFSKIFVSAKLIALICPAGADHAVFIKQYAVVRSCSRCSGNNFGTVDTVCYRKKLPITRFTSRVSSELTVSVDAAGSYIAVGIYHDGEGIARRNKFGGGCALKVSLFELVTRRFHRLSAKLAVLIAADGPDIAFLVQQYGMVVARRNCGYFNARYAVGNLFKRRILSAGSLSAELAVNIITRRPDIAVLIKQYRMSEAARRTDYFDIFKAVHLFEFCIRRSVVHIVASAKLTVGVLPRRPNAAVFVNKNCVKLSCGYRFDFHTAVSDGNLSEGFNIGSVPIFPRIFIDSESAVLIAAGCPYLAVFVKYNDMVRPHGDIDYFRRGADLCKNRVLIYIRTQLSCELSARIISSRVKVSRIVNSGSIYGRRNNLLYNRSGGNAIELISLVRLVLYTAAERSSFCDRNDYAVAPVRAVRRYFSAGGGFHRYIAGFACRSIPECEGRQPAHNHAENKQNTQNTFFHLISSVSCIMLSADILTHHCNSISKRLSQAVLHKRSKNDTSGSWAVDRMR